MWIPDAEDMPTRQAQPAIMPYRNANVADS